VTATSVATRTLSKLPQAGGVSHILGWLSLRYQYKVPLLHIAASLPASSSSPPPTRDMARVPWPCHTSRLPRGLLDMVVAVH
jgi:hypothetical protein